MSRSRRGRSRSHYRSGSYGRTRALAHIAAANRLTAELGGMDQGVKSYFLNLPPVELAAILDDYQRAYGSQAREYATDTIPKWRTGRVRMSGMWRSGYSTCCHRECHWESNISWPKVCGTTLARVPNIGSELEATLM